MPSADTGEGERSRQSRSSSDVLAVGGSARQPRAVAAVRSAQADGGSHRLGVAGVLVAERGSADLNYNVVASNRAHRRTGRAGGGGTIVLSAEGRNTHRDRLGGNARRRRRGRSAEH